MLICFIYFFIAWIFLFVVLFAPLSFLGLFWHTLHFTSQGILLCARYVKSKLEKEELLERAFSRAGQVVYIK